MIAPTFRILTHQGTSLTRSFPRWEEYLREKNIGALSRHPAWLSVLQRSMGHVPYCLEAQMGNRTCGYLPLAQVQSWLFGKFLVSLPFLNSAGVIADNEDIANELIDHAVQLADQMRVKYLELRHEQIVEHPAFTDHTTHKVHFRLDLPPRPDDFWDSVPSRVRNQIRKGRKQDLTVHWGGQDLLSEFYDVFSHNMRDLGTPVYPRELFSAALSHFPKNIEICVVRKQTKAVAGGFLLHGESVTEIPSASSLREYNPTNANMLMYWHLIERAIQRGQAVFDFGRTTIGSGTYHFKTKWGGKEIPARWQYYRRTGDNSGARPDNPRYQKLIRLWQKLPVSVANLIGPFVVKGIP